MVNVLMETVYVKMNSTERIVVKKIAPIIGNLIDNKNHSLIYDYKRILK